jgi:putative transposase
MANSGFSMTYSRLFYHIVWTTKQRLPLITESNEAAIYRVICDKVAELNGIVHAANGMPDHVHLVVTLLPTLALANTIGQFKGSSSFIANRIAGQSQSFAWQKEYGVLSISESHVPVIIRYVEQQKQHHATNKLDARLELTQLAT